MVFSGNRAPAELMLLLTFPSVCLCNSSDPKMDMAFPKHSIMQALSVLLLAWVLVHCQTTLEAEEEEDDETDAVPTMGTKSMLIECPAECSCTAEGAVDCAGVDLIEFPAELSEATRQLSLQVSDSTTCTLTVFCNSLFKNNDIFNILISIKKKVAHTS